MGEGMQVATRRWHVYSLDLLGLGLPVTATAVSFVVAVTMSDPLIFGRVVILTVPYVVGYLVGRVLRLSVGWTALLAGAVVLLVLGHWMINREPTWLSLRHAVSLWLMYVVAPAAGLTVSILLDRLARIKAR